MKKTLIGFLTLIFISFLLTACVDNSIPLIPLVENWSAKINTNSEIYFDELRNDQLKLDISYYGFDQELLRFELIQGSNDITINKDVLYFSSSIADNYEFNVYVYDDRLKSPLIVAKKFYVKLTRGLISGDGEISQVILTVKGDPETSRGISWFTSSDILESDVLVSKTESFENYIHYIGERKVFEKYANKDDQKTNLPKTKFYNHQADITDLEKNTYYYYKVGSLSKNLFSKYGSFKTSGGNQTTIVLTSDIHVGIPEGVLSKNRFYHTALADAFRRTNNNVDLIVSTGDNISQWNDGNYYFEYEWSRFMNVSSYLKQATFVTMSGNHDTNVNDSEFDYAFPNHFNLPDSPKEIDDGHIIGPNYSFDYNNTHFIVFNYHQIGGISKGQIDWLLNDLTNNTLEKIIFFSHIEVPISIKNILEKYNVAIAYSGHRHFYRRTPLIKNDVKQKSVYVNNLIQKSDGTMYVINSSTGGNSGWRPYSDSLIDDFGFGHESDLGTLGLLKSLKAGMYSILIIKNNRIEVNVYVRNSHNALDKYHLYDSYGLIF